MNSKHGVYFCCREHKDLGQRIGSGIPEIHPPHYGKENPKHAYRAKALRQLPHECAKCGYDEIVEVLQVHHLDGDRSNNELENLQILCPTCHQIEHLRL